MSSRRFGIDWRKVSFLSALVVPLLYGIALAQRSQGQGQQFPIQFPIPPPIQQDTARPPVLKMRVEAGKVTAEIRDCPLQNALRELADRTGIVFEVRSQDNPPVSISLQSIPLQEAVQRLAASSNTMFVYSDKAPGPEQIAMVRLFPRTAEPVQPGIIYLGTGAITKGGDFLEAPEQALKVLAESADARERQSAVGVLAAGGHSEAAVKALISAVSDPAPEVRAAAIESLAALDARSALPSVLRRLKDANPGVRQAAAGAVGLLGSSANLIQIKPLTVDKDAGVAAAAESAMRKLASADRE